MGACTSSLPSPSAAPTAAPKAVSNPASRAAVSSVSSSPAPSASPSAASAKPSKSLKPKDRYEFFEVLGKGGFGEVRRGKRKADGKMCVEGAWAGGVRG